MNSAQSGQPDDDDHHFDSALNLSASKLDVYKHERLAYTELPVRACASRSVCKRVSVTLEVVYQWLLSIFTVL